MFVARGPAGSSSKDKTPALKTTEFLIIGGGPTGLGAATRLQAKGADWQLIEAEPHFGGLAASFRDERGFTWDLGGHVQFSHYETFDRFMDAALGKDGWLYHERESWIWIRNRFVPYPFQNNLHRLDPADRDRCVEGLRRATEGARAGRPPPENFREWILQTFGEGVAELFLFPYNFKVWAYPPEMLDFHWIGERVAVPKLADILRAIETNEDQISWGPNRTFRFPKFGGTGAVWQAIGRFLPRERVHLSERVVRIRARDHIAETDGGEAWRYRYIISSMPLNQLLSVVDLGAGHEVKDRLRFSSTYIVGVGMMGQPPAHLATKCWMYFPESHSPYYRITVFTNYSPNNAPEPGRQWSLMTETSESPFKPVNGQSIVEETLKALRQDRLLPRDAEIVSVVCRYLPQSYPTPFLGRDGLVDPLLRRLEEADIFSRGRFGAWKYEVSNQDHCFAQGYECAERLSNRGGPEYEPTLFMPSLVNSRRNP